MIFPKSKAGEKEYRRRKRLLEIELTVEAIKVHLASDPNLAAGKLNILEFGSGDGFQISHLQQLGTVVASDIYTSPDILARKDVIFHECSITATPFKDGQFDLICSNHVMEHVEDAAAAFAELKRIGSTHCLYAISVPTNWWLLFDVFAQYYDKARVTARRLTGARRPANTAPTTAAVAGPARPKRSLPARILNWILPGGHGVHAGFTDCFRAFRIKSWEEFYRRHGMEIIRVKPLLLYGASEWPIIPTFKVADDARICSSVLFLMKKRGVNTRVPFTAHAGDS